MVDYGSHPFHDFLEADFFEVNLDSENACTLYRPNNFGWVEQDFRWNTAPCQAYAARFILVDNGDLDVRVPLHHTIYNIHG
jgi:hypothetical protein